MGKSAEINDQELAFSSQRIATVFEGFPSPERAKLLALRALIFETAASLPQIGQIEETLKWGQPAYLTSQTKSGTTIRLGVQKQGGAALFIHCQTTVIPEFQHMFPDEFTFDGTRAVHIRKVDTPTLQKLKMLITRALSYHLK